MSESIVTGIFTLAGVIIGGLLNYVITLLLERARGKKEVQVLTLCEYEMLCDELRKYISDHISYKELADYYDHYSKREAEIKAQQIMYFSKKQIEIVNSVKIYTWKLLSEEKISQLYGQLQRDIEKLK